MDSGSLRQGQQITGKVVLFEPDVFLHNTAVLLSIADVSISA
jgi:hypothetical protein